ncbi:LANO_0F02388g1_1 [Lachancea nothofagi CBS 11611]|uniref:LANO_0F02388g1_1 n=1 Tax=Lachancea nothofagi CBS 11611 TaxID=1266666 RepID=A0A1G4K6T2_9SACH|nr:LANO_0F02388g1_1 [Lachancea nothofagi CBS 11611]
MHSGALIQQSCFQELHQLTALPRIKILQKGSKVRPSLPSIRQLLRDIQSRNGTRNSPTPNKLFYTTGQPHVYSSVSPGVHESGLLPNYTRLSQRNFDLTTTGVSEAPQPSLHNNICDDHIIHAEHTRLVRLQPHRPAPRPPLNTGNIQKPSGDLLKLAYAVEASTNMGRTTVTGNHVTDSIIHFNGDYQLKIAEILESLQAMYRNLQEWPLSMHSQDVARIDKMSLLIDYISPESLESTTVMAKRAYDSLMTISQWKTKYKKLHIGLHSRLVDTRLEKSSKVKKLRLSKNKFKEDLKRHLKNSDPAVALRGEYDAGEKTAKDDLVKPVESFSAKKLALIESEDESTKAGLQCAHCLSTKTPEWRKGPYGKRSLCNACGLFYKKLVRKFDDAQAALIMKYRKRVSSKDRKVPRVFDVPDNQL